MQEMRVPSPGWEDPLEEEMATHSSTPAWRIPLTEEPGQLQSMGLQRVIMTEHAHTEHKDVKDISFFPIPHPALGTNKTRKHVYKLSFSKVLTLAKVWDESGFKAAALSSQRGPRTNAGQQPLPLCCLSESTLLLLSPLYPRFLIRGTDSICRKLVPRATVLGFCALPFTCRKKRLFYLLTRLPRQHVPTHQPRVKQWQGSLKHLWSTSLGKGLCTNIQLCSTGLDRKQSQERYFSIFEVKVKEKQKVQVLRGFSSLFQFSGVCMFIVGSVPLEGSRIHPSEIWLKYKHTSFYCGSKKSSFFYKLKVCGNHALSDDGWHFLTIKFFKN